MVFIDARNLLSAWHKYFSDNKRPIEKVSYSKLLLEIAKDTDFIRGYYYDAVPEPVVANRQSFFDKLRSNQITIITKPLKYKSVKCAHCKHTDLNVPYQKGVDVALVTDTISLAVEKAYDIAIIVSGDNDFVDAVNFVKAKGLKVWVVSFSSALGDDLMRSADRIIKLDTMVNELIL